MSATIVLSSQELRRFRRRWQGMHERCTSENHKSYDRYGGRGIYVDSAWDTFEAFLEWALSNGFEPGLTIDRIDNDGPYSPSNCRFVPHIVNCNNQERATKVAALGESKSTAMWARDSRVPVSRRTVGRRIRSGVSADDAVLKPARAFVDRLLTAFGETKTIAEWTKDARCVVPYSALLFRLDAGWDGEESLVTPSRLVRGRQRTAERVSAFGELKTYSEWAADERAAVGVTTIRQRIVAYGWGAERAITTPSKR